MSRDMEVWGTSTKKANSTVFVEQRHYSFNSLQLGVLVVFQATKILDHRQPPNVIDLLGSALKI